MAQRVVESNYENMINALNNGAKKIYDDATALMGYANTCAAALGDGDSAVAPLVESVSIAQQGYAECAAEAVRIANLMQEELDEIRKEKDVWASEE